MSWAPTVKVTRHKRPQYKRQHKAARLQAMLRERAAIAKGDAQLDRRIDRSLRKVEAAFKGCEVP